MSEERPEENDATVTVDGEELDKEADTPEENDATVEPETAKEDSTDQDPG